MKDFELRYVGSHVEVYTGSGVFLFSADTVRLLRAGDYTPAVCYVVLSIAVCLLFTALGMLLGSQTRTA